MLWKNWPYWLKGGLIGAITVSTVEIIDSLILPALCLYEQSSKALNVLGCIFPSRIANIPLMYLGLFFGSRIVDLILAIIFYFAVGAIVGWIVGKIKS